MGEGEPDEPVKREWSSWADHAREAMLDALRLHEPLAVLTSLSLVTAAFLQISLEGAVPFAAAATTGFLFALVSSLVRHAIGSVPAYSYALSIVSVVGVGLGFFMLLALVVWVFALSFDLVGATVLALVSILIVMTAFASALATWDLLSQIRKAAPERWSKTKAYLTSSGVVSVASAVILTGDLILVLQGIVAPGVEQTWLLGLALVGSLAPLVYVGRVHRVAVGRRETR